MIAVYMKRKGTGSVESDPLGTSRREREQNVDMAIEKLNEFKNSAKLNMKPEKFKYELTMRVRKLERELGIKVVTSSILSEGDIVLDYA